METENLMGQSCYILGRLLKPRNGIHLAPGEYLCLCPFVETHVLLNTRFGLHLTKCRRNYIKKLEESSQQPLYTVCAFNHDHKVIDAELNLHEEICPERYKRYPMNSRNFSGLESSSLPIQNTIAMTPTCSDRMSSLGVAEVNSTSPSPKPSRRSGIAKALVKLDELAEDSPNMELCLDKVEKLQINPEPEENWELELQNNPRPTYDCRDRTELDPEHMFYVTPPAGLTKSERKKFRALRQDFYFWN